MSQSLEPDTSSIALKRTVLRAIGWDAIGWGSPLVAAAVMATAPGLRSLGGWTEAVIIVTATVSALFLARDFRWFRTRGCTPGLERYKLRVIDPIRDQILWKARLEPKRVTRLLKGEYEVINF
jgi:hypothetical protein